MPQSRFIIDKITNSIEEIATGNSLLTTIQLATEKDIKGILKKNGWFFNWKSEYKIDGRQTYKLLLQDNPEIQGLISLEALKNDKYIEMHLIESAPHNYGAKKRFLGVAGNLVAFACKLSFEMGFDGFVAFTAKTKLINHYIETLGARLLMGNSRMGIFTPEAKKLVNSYYKDQ